MPKLPAHALVPLSGSLSALLFENPRAGVVRDVYWSVSVQFAPIRYGAPGQEEEFDCEATTEWLRLGLRDWRALEGVSLDGGPEFASSFCVAEHEPAIATHLRVSAREGATFLVDLDLKIAFHGFFGEDADPALPVSAHLRVPFDGVKVHAGLLMPAPGGDAEALALLAPFVDVSAFTGIVTQTNQFKVSTFVLMP
jgi:hypothetical protein